ncbi:hypothetical protein BDQ17DRAFT_1342228 [Cyathus striatus]|nr:hypothetical protein BDQ17DRAFT_1342228 [Cyathus striatus]
MTDEIDSIFPEDIRCLLRTNDIPSLQQVLDTDRIREECTTKRTYLECEMQKVYTEIERQKAILRKLEARHADKMRELDSCSLILSPIRRILPELLAEIFRHCLPSDGIPSLDTAPLLLCQVCQLWKDVCIRDPRLWTRFVIKMSPDDVKDTAGDFLRDAEQWFERARDLSLSLHLDIRVSMPRGAFDVPLVNPNFLNAPIEKLAESSFFQQIARLEVNGNDMCAVPSLIPQNNQFDRLETLRLSFRHGFIASHESQRSFQNAPCLRHLSIASAGRRPIPISIFPWHQLTNLYLSHCLGSRTFASILPQCRNLQKAIVHLMDEFPSMEPPVRADVTTLPQLMELSITFSDSGTPFIFANVVMPSLFFLALGSSLPDSLIGIGNRRRLLFKYEDWQPYLYHQLGNLQKLSITKTRTFDFQDFLSLLHSTPSICELEIILQWTLAELDNLFMHLTDLVKESDSLPLLRCLRISCPTAFSQSHSGSPVSGIEEVADNFSELVRYLHVNSSNRPHSIQSINLIAPTEYWTSFFHELGDILKPYIQSGLVLSTEIKIPLDREILGYSFGVLN